MIDLVRSALRISGSDFDEEIESLIESCVCELESIGVISDRDLYDNDPQIVQTVIAYCKWQFGENQQADKWEHIYNIKVARLKCTTGYGLGACANG